MENAQQTISPAQAEAELTRVTQGWAEAYSAMDKVKSASFFADDAILYPQNAPMAKGVPAIEAVFEKVFSLGDTKLTYTPITSVINGDIAYQVGAYDQTITPMTGSPIRDRGEAIIIMKRAADGDWKIVHDMYNSDLSAAE